ncbi:MAG: redoxin domain-containing protein [Fibrobacteraceae bacterium]|nr:redoxin domain-containing protein [Fibrobacteraceae bacterium]
MKLFVRLFAFVALAAGFSFAQLAPEPQMADIQIFKDSTGTPKKMDFSIPLTGVSDPGILFSHFSKKNLLIYYFSPKCPHCQRHFPEMQNLMKEYEASGLTGIAIGLGGGIKKNDIRMFIDQQKAVIPVFQDTDTKFGPEFGTGYIPVVYLVLKDGTFYRYETINEANINHMRATLNELFKK